MGLLEYGQDRETELDWMKKHGEVPAEASVAFPMYGLAPKKTNTIFFLKSGMKKPVVVLMMNVRQEIAESVGNDEPDERLREQLIGNFGVIRENFEKHGILNVVTARPRLTVKNVNGSLFEFDCKKKRETSVNFELERYKKELKRSRGDCAVSPTSASPRPSTVPASPACSVFFKPFALDGDSTFSPSSASTCRDALSPVVGSVLRSPSQVRLVRSYSPDGRVLEEVSTMTGVFKDVRLTCSSSPVNGEDSSDDEERHVDLTTMTTSESEPDVFFPFVHFTFSEWIGRGETKATYWKMCKRGAGGLEFIDERVPVVTTKQIREEDRRHIERLKSNQSWAQRVEFLGGTW